MKYTRHNIITLPHPDLRKRSARVHVITDEILQLIQDMTDISHDWEDSRPHELTVGFAAVQMDQLQRVVLIRADFDDKNNREFVALINPEIIKTEGEPVYDHEGCLSVSDVYGLVPRYPKVRIKAIDINGQEVRIKAQGFLARILQHEVDHTNGITFVDHIDQDKDAFFILNAEGNLEKIDYETVAARGIFRQ